MGLLGLYDQQAVGGNRVTHGFSFRPNGATGIVSGSTKGKRISTITRTGVGTYNVPFTHSAEALDSFVGFAQSADGVGLTVTGGDWDSTTNSMVLKVMRGAGGLGIIPLDITSMREIASDAIQNLAAHGGLLASDSDPALARVNGATDKALRVIWDTSNDTDEAQFAPVAKPPDFDAGSDVTVHLMMAKGSNTDTSFTVDVQAYDGVGDTEMGGATAAFAAAALAEKTVTLANANLAAGPGFLNISLVPGTHENDDLYLYAAWLEYTKLGQAVDLTADANNVIHGLAVFRNGADI